MIRKLFKNDTEFFELNELSNADWQTRNGAIVQALDFEACKNILFIYTTYDKLLNAYKKDKNLNNILNSRHYCRNVLPEFFRYTNDTCWQWDIIGYQMLHNNRATIKFKDVILRLLTNIAKACAIQVIKNESEVVDNV